MPRNWTMLGTGEREQLTLIVVLLNHAFGSHIPRIDQCCVIMHMNLLPSTDKSHQVHSTYHTVDQLI